MYFVDKNLLNERLDYIVRLTQEIEHVDSFALERVSQMLIEATVDVGNMVIDAFILRDPGNYKDVMDILELEGVISKEDNQSFQQFFNWRNQLVREYTSIDHSKLKEDALTHIEAFKNFKPSVHQFFNHDSQSITAFKGDQ